MPYKGTVLSIAGTLLGGVMRQAVSTGLNVNADAVAGSLYPLQANIVDAKAKLTFTTCNVKKALALVGANGLAISATPIIIYELLYTDQGTLASGTVHRKLTINAGRLVPRNLSCSHQGNASLDLEMIAISDGVAVGLAGATTAPVLYTESIAAPTLTQADIDDERYTLGPCTIGGIDIGCLQDLAIDFGLQVDATGCNSNPYPTQLEQKTIGPMVTGTTRDVQKFAAAVIPFAGAAATQANTTIYLRRRKPSTGDFELYANTVHIKINSAGMLMMEEPFSADGVSNATAKFKLQCLFDGTNSPLVISTASAIT